MEVDICAVSGRGCRVSKKRPGRTREITAKSRQLASDLPLHANQLQVAAKVARVQSGNGQAVAEASHGSLEVALVKVGIQVGGAVDGGVHVGPDERDGAAGDAAALVANLDGDVLLALGDNDLCDGKLLLVHAVGLDDGAQRVFERLKEHVRQVAGHVHEVEVGVADELDLGGLEEAVMVLADEAGILNGLLGEVLDVCLCANDADIGGVAVVALVRQGNVLAEEHADADAGHVEAVEEGLDAAVNLEALALALVLEDALGHGGDDAVVAALDLVQGLGEALVVEVQLGGPGARVVDGGVVAARERLGLGAAVAVCCVAPARGILVNGRIGCGLGELLVAAHEGVPRGLHQAISCFLVELGAGKLCDFLGWGSLGQRKGFGRNAGKRKRLFDQKEEKKKNNPLGGNWSTHFERLGVPVLDLDNRGHVVYAVGQVFQFADSVG